MQSFSSVITEHFLKPRNVGDLGSAGFAGKAGSLTCGAVLRVTLVIDASRRITDAKFKAAGCSSLVAAASVLTEEVRGELAGEVAALLQAPQHALSAVLGDVPADKAHCIALVRAGLLSAITAYSYSVRDEWRGEEALICTCFCVSELTIQNAIEAAGLRTITEVTKACNAGGGCRSCHSLIEDMLASAER